MANFSWKFYDGLDKRRLMAVEKVNPSFVKPQLHFNGGLSKLWLISLVK